MSQMQRVRAHDPECYYNITQMIQSKGYVYEEHKVITPDGYILGLYRIPHGRNSSSSKPGRPVLLQHGLLDSGTTWVMNFPDQSLGFILADAGYDVWIGNSRGSRYSRAHVKYNPQHDEAFWDFSWDEMATFDLPSMISYILNVTQQTKISYVGHSQGTAIGFAQFGNPNSTVAKNVSFWAALAPVAHLGHIKSPFRYLTTPTIQIDLEVFWHILFGKNEFLPSDAITQWLGAFACAKSTAGKDICENIYFVIFGPDKKNLNETRLPVYIAHVPDGTSVKNMIHLAEGVQTNLFEKYDYGTAEENQQHYNQTTPPLYDIRPMTVPTAIFSGGEDWLADPTDVDYIYSQIQTETLVFRKSVPEYNHMDFVWGLTANKIIYADLLEQMRKHHPPN